MGKGSWGPGGGLGDGGLRPCAAWLALGQGRVLLFVHPCSLFHLLRRQDAKQDDFCPVLKSCPNLSSTAQTHRLPFALPRASRAKWRSLKDSTGGAEYLSGPGWLVGRVDAPTIVIQGLPVPGQDLLLFLKLLLLLLLLQGLEVGMLLLQLPLQALGLPLLLQLLPLVFLGPSVGREGSAGWTLEARAGTPLLSSNCLERRGLFP